MRAGVYEHFKGGRYALLGVAKNCTNGDHEGKFAVIYLSLQTGEMFVRDMEEFLEPLESGLPRFRWIAHSLTEV